MFTVLFKALLIAVSKIVHKTCTFLQGDSLNLFSYGCLQSNNGTRVVLVDVALQELSEEKTSQVFKSREWGAHSTLGLRLIRRSPNFLRGHAMVTFALFFLLLKILTLYKFKFLHQLENLAPVLKRVEIELPSLSFLNNFERIK